MRNIAANQQKIFDISSLLKQITSWRVLGKSIAFTNGCFDILHEGHIFSLSQAAIEADYLIVALNSDASVKRQGKSPERPINNEKSRSILLANLSIIGAIVIFDEDTPLNIIKAIMPDVLVKGGDYTINQIVGANEVIANGGRVVINNILEGFSTTNLISKLIN